MRSHTHRRGGFTLIELLVVIGIILTLMALTAAALTSAFATSQNVSRNADLLSGWLLSARQMARRDGVPTGVQFTVGADGICRELRYIRQPDDLALGRYIGRVETPPYNVARIQSPASLAEIQAGDYFELYGGGLLRRVVNFPGTGSPVAVEDATAGIYRLCLAPPPPAPATPPPPPTYALTDYTGVPLPASPTDLGQAAVLTNYRVIAQPRPISGEAALEMKNDIGIDFNTRTYSPLPGNVLSNPPTRSGQYEILFGPSGAVIGQNTSVGMIYLWVREIRPVGTPDNSTDRLAGRPVLVTIQTRTGFIASHPVRPQGDPYTFARDGRASGM